ncbi:MAG: DUF4864 domain-containing protein [Candidatus Rokuibacteriota bacterium]
MAAVATAQPAGALGDATRVALRQLDAFRQGDFDAAYGFASSDIRQMFDRQAFERMVRGGYPEIARSVSGVVTDGRVEPGGPAWITLVIHGANGHTIEALYELVWEDAQWRINGVVTRPDASPKT